MNDGQFAGSGAVINPASRLPSSTSAAVDKIRELEAIVLSMPQEVIFTHHVIHAGVYSRTIRIAAGVVLTGALIKIPTTLVVCGKCSVLIGDAEEVLVEGYHVFAASAHRKQAYIAHEDTYVTMSFRTNARTVEEAEAEFTSEHELLMSRHGINEIVITGE